MIQFLHCTDRTQTTGEYSWVYTLPTSFSSKIFSACITPKGSGDVYNVPANTVSTLHFWCADRLENYIVENMFYGIVIGV